MTWWNRWFGAFHQTRKSHRIVVYSRQDCPLCDQALAALEKLKARFNLEIEVVDIDLDSELRQRHGEWAPVVEIDGVVRFRGKINEVLLRRLLRRQRDH